MAERRRGFVRWLLPKLLIFVLGVAAGYYVRDNELSELREAYQQAVDELTELRETTGDMIERGRRAGESVRSGAEAAVDSTKAAVEEIKGDSTK
jgi:hypothetical protein